MGVDVAVLGQVLLAVVLLVGGTAKALDPWGTRSAAEGFGVPSALMPGIVLTLPLAELSTAALLLLAPAVGLPLALALLLAAAALVVRSLLRGRRTDCTCAARLGSGDVSWRTVLRDLGLAALAVAALVDGPTTSLHAVPALVGAGLAGLLLLLEGQAGRRRETAARAR